MASKFQIENDKKWAKRLRPRREKSELTTFPESAYSTLAIDNGYSKRRRLLTGEEQNTTQSEPAEPLNSDISTDATEKLLRQPSQAVSPAGAQNSATANDKPTCHASSNDDDGDHLLSHVEYIHNGSQTRKQRMRRSDIAWPVYPDKTSRCCETCNAVTGTRAGLRALRSPRGYKHLNWYDLQERASKGCALCQNIWDVTEHSYWDYEDDGWVVRDEIRITGNFRENSGVQAGIPRSHPLKGMLLDGIKVEIPSHGEPMEEWHTVTFPADPVSSIVLGRRESTDLTKEAAAETLPCRVIDVKSPIPCLYHSLPDEEAEYATLSYCWGGVSQPTTTRANLQDHLKSIDLAGLPKTVADGIRLCRAIGIRYFWVDALCIVQDDDEDKLDQIARMGTIYKNSALTIIVAGAEKVTDGFLGHKKPKEFHAPDIELPMYVDGVTTGTVYLRMKDLDRTYANQEPIFQRGWTYQELLLSPRLIVFDSTQITLKCLTDYYRPVFETYLSTKVDAPELPAEVFGMVTNYQMTFKGSLASKERYISFTQDHIWSGILHDYSERDLSCFADRLPALAGITTELAKVWNDQYLAGFWRRTIVKHLGWHRTERKFRGFEKGPGNDLFDSIVDRKRRSGRPTWSWITVPYPVCLYHSNVFYEPELELIDSGVTLESQRSPFGNIKSAFITLRGRLLEVPAAMGPDVEVEVLKGYQQPDDQVKIWLDVEEPKPRINVCRMLFLSHPRDYEGFFLVIEPRGGNRYVRVGITVLKHNVCPKKPCVWKEQLQAAESEIIVLE